MGYKRRFSALKTGLAAALLLPAFLDASEFKPERRQDLLADAATFQAVQALKPAYRLLEGISDGIFDAMRLHLFSQAFALIDSDFRQYKKSDSYAIFEQEFRGKEARLLQRLYERNDHSWSRDEQVSVVVDSLKESLLARYHIDRLEKWASRYASNPDNWQPSSLTAAAIVGGSFLYLNGAHTQAAVGSAKIGVDLKSGLRVLHALRTAKTVARAVGLEMSWNNHPLSVTSDWGVADGKLRSERYGFKYRIEFR